LSNDLWIPTGAFFGEKFLQSSVSIPEVGLKYTKARKNVKLSFCGDITKVTPYNRV